MRSDAKLYVFTLMPFTQTYKDLYRYGIKKVCEDLDMYCERVDEANFEGSIYDRIVNQITKADIIISVLIDRNPNVFYETGFAHAKKKVVIHICKDVDDIPFDLKGFQHVEHSGTIEELEEKLRSKLQWAIGYLENRSDELHPLSFKFFYQGKPLEAEMETDLNISYRNDGTVFSYSAFPILDILNSGAEESQKLGPIYVYTGKEVIGIRKNDIYNFPAESPASGQPSVSEDAQFAYRYRLDFESKLAAGEWRSIPFQFNFSRKLTPQEGGSRVPIRLRFLTEATPLDLDVSLNLRSKAPQDEPVIDIVVDDVPWAREAVAHLAKDPYPQEGVSPDRYAITAKLRNNSPTTQIISTNLPFFVYTDERVARIDSSEYGYPSYTETKGNYLKSDVEGYPRKFAPNVGYPITEYSEAALRLIMTLESTDHDKISSWTLPMLLKVYTRNGPIEHPLNVRFQV